MTTITFPELCELHAKQTNKPQSDANKRLRARLRSNFATLAEIAPESYGKSGKIKEHANDRRPWGVVPVTFARDVLKVEVPTVARKRTSK